MKGIWEMVEDILRLAGLVVMVISIAVKILDLVQQWKDKKVSKKQPPELGQVAFLTAQGMDDISLGKSLILL